MIVKRSVPVVGSGSENASVLKLYGVSSYGRASHWACASRVCTSTEENIRDGTRPITNIPPIPTDHSTTASRRLTQQRRRTQDMVVPSPHPTGLLWESVDIPLVTKKSSTVLTR